MGFIFRRQRTSNQPVRRTGSTLRRRAFAFRARRRTVGTVHDALSIGCPHCGETFSLAFDVSEGSAAFTVDCEVCCRPMTVMVRVDADGEIAGLDIAAE